ncbi:MAG: rRNA maturation RNase YbeY [Verrucomicrobia bacterium]|nr:MAG: rRNA maturation RNase YbeY [Verrucomicrobiota bacterium]
MEANDAIPRIAIRNLQRTISVNLAELETFAGNAVQYCLQLQRRKRTDLYNLREVFIWLISDRRMALLHRKFLGQSGPTDVMTFQHGEVFISVETARGHARAFGNSLLRELKLYIVHGLLHLHGFDDQTASEAHRMKAAQEKILRACTRHRVIRARTMKPVPV